MKRIIYSMILTSALTLPAFATHAQTVQGQAQGTATLIPGAELDRGTVENLQQQLSTRGYYQGSPDGQWNESTMKAMNLYEHESGGTVQSDGMLDTTTLDALGITQLNRGTANTTAANTTLRGATRSSSTLDGGIGGNATLSGGIGGHHSLGGPTPRTTSAPTATTGAIGGSTSGSVSSPAP